MKKNQLSNYKVVTITHKTSSLKNIGDFVITGSEPHIRERLERLKTVLHLDELLYLATCNRILFLFSAPQPLHELLVRRLLTLVNPSFTNEQIKHRISAEVLTYEGVEAISHLFEVAASIDSLVVGEREILRQLREAYDQCLEWNLTGDNLRLLMRYAVTTAKKIYAQTRIGEKPISIVSLSIQKLLEEKLPRRSRILIIGAGQTNLLVSKFLLKHEFQNVTVFNRTLEKAQRMAKRFMNGKAFSLDDLENYTEGFDLMIVCTGATQPIVTNRLYEKLVHGESDKKLIIDLSVPNNVERNVMQHFLVKYIEIEDLRQLAKQNLAFREREVTNAKVLIAEEIKDFKEQFRNRQLELAMGDIPVQIKAAKEKAMNEVFKKELSELDDKTLELMERMMAYMEKKCISIPMKVAKKATLGEI